MIDPSDELPNDPDEPPVAELRRLLLRTLAEQQQQRREQARTNAAITLLANAIRKLEGTLGDTPGVREQRWLDAMRANLYREPGHHLKKD